MKTKRQLLEHFLKEGNCADIYCRDCPYSEKSTGKDTCPVKKLMSIGAMAILRMFRKKKKPVLSVGTKIKFDSGDIATEEYEREMRGY